MPEFKLSMPGRLRQEPIWEIRLVTKVDLPEPMPAPGKLVTLDDPNARKKGKHWELVGFTDGLPWTKTKWWPDSHSIIAPGDFFWVTEDTDTYGPKGSLVVSCPGCGIYWPTFGRLEWISACSGHDYCGRHWTTRQRPEWSVSGTREKPTTNPSLYHPDCWHGWLQDGYYRSC